MSSQQLESKYITYETNWKYQNWPNKYFIKFYTSWNQLKPQVKPIYLLIWKMILFCYFEIMD